MNDSMYIANRRINPLPVAINRPEITIDIRLGGVISGHQLPVVIRASRMNKPYQAIGRLHLENQRQRG
jgi:hypothetical protein